MYPHIAGCDAWACAHVSIKLLYKRATVSITVSSNRVVGVDSNHQNVRFQME